MARAQGDELAASRQKLRLVIHATGNAVKWVIAAMQPKRGNTWPCAPTEELRIKRLMTRGSVIRSTRRS